MLTSIPSLTPLSKGERGKQLQQVVWKEMMDALVKNVPEVRELAML
jgi:hypothetical protein